MFLFFYLLFIYGERMVGLNELSEEIARKILSSPREVKKIIQIFLEEVVDKVRRGEEVKIAGFGTFYLKTQKEKRIREIGSGRLIEIPKRKRFAFRSSSKIKWK